ncbi:MULTISPECIES: T6SS effector BTH_I2691 family protein [Providencia]|uniref:T6SS effector BTH_I2691 family protein n=1 Tax=Providencia TaxID=586 RepID=UPI000D6EC9FC|nr:MULTISPECIES: T6SS effector BTH_I2691 family protein [Providencia]AWS52099.1 hypothetical protein AM461_15355 [Providencia rettgeri]MBS0916365.1 hypothetical protein [Providencia rettgeri]MCG5291602.1 hypothetical protein [Providencia rettgeri]MCL0019124.1 hypothetical protein [Providencia rettgeri]MCX9124030.1 hypothetical protein [Providencia rettgeri]
MTEQNQSQGCNFCIRQGLPILLARPAIMSKQDILPVMPQSIHVPVEAQGETAYTLRLLRSGYLNIWDEIGNEWINYYITEEGFYYPLPPDGDVPDNVVSGKIKPCISQPEELAKASLIALPMMPKGMKNGQFWFAWSEVKWTDTIRKQFEEKSHREQYMQRFDMDAWLNNQNTEQALPLAQIENTIAEYNQHAQKSQMRDWSTSLLSRALDGFITYSYRFKTQWFTPTASGEKIETAVQSQIDQLDPRGAIFVLQDPTGILKDLPTLIQYELDKNVYSRPDIERKVALYGAISSLKAGMRTDFERAYTAETEFNDKIARGGVFEYLHVRNKPAIETIYTPVRDKRMSAAADANWAKYQQYYYADAVDDFRLKFQKILTEYNQRVVSPRTKLYLDWFQSSALQYYFQQYFDPNDLLSGIAYTTIVSYCITNMSDKKGSLDFFHQSLLNNLSDPSNILGRALVLNQAILAEKIDEATAQQSIEVLELPWSTIDQNISVSKITLPWSGLADAFAKVIEPQRLASQSVIAIYLGRLATITMKAFDSTISSPKVYAFAIAIGAFQNKEIVRVHEKAKFGHFVKKVSDALIRLSDSNNTLNESEIRRLAHEELKRLRVSGLPMNKNKILDYWVDIDTRELDRVKQLPPQQQERALTKLLRLFSETEATNYAQYRTSMTSGTGKSAIIVSAGGLSVILQSLALFHSADLSDKKTLSEDQFEAHSRFLSGIAGIISGIIGVLDESVQRFVLLRSFKNITAYNTLKTVGVRLGVGAGIVAVAFDIFNAIDEIGKNNYGLFIAYLLSAASGVWLIFAALVSTIPVFGTVIAVLIALGTAIFIAYEGQDNIQKWLEQCWWRRVPKHIPVDKWPEIYPSMWMEMAEFKRAIGQ